MLSPLSKATVSKDRSRCLHCGHTLKWYDLLPLASWALLGGKCRYCRAKIGWLEPSIEIGVALFFVVSYLAWPASLATALDVTQFVLWLIAGVLLAMLFVYDLKWYMLPNYIVFPLIAVGGLSAILHIVESPDTAGALISMAAGIVILSGLYLSLWVLSKGQWIGFGDVKLGLALALMLGSWPLAFITLFAANVIGCFIVVPGLLSGKMTRKTRVPFGPLLIAGYIVAGLWGHAILGYYLSYTLF
jgi:prepilin signal peptidase PulO-like enzyme (type II secretory pathway)